MSAALFYVDALAGPGERAVVDGDEGHHAANVRRIRVGEHIDLSDGAGTLAHCVVEHTAKGSITARIMDRLVLPQARPAVTVVQALPKSDRSELAVELATEAGADAFVAWQSARCVARWDGPKADKGLRRWSAVARSAARRSRRAYIPTVTGVDSTQDLVRRIASTDAVVLALHESATEPIVKMPLAETDSVILIVGPEGGIADDEIATLTDAGAHAVRLGPTVLRTSTAAAVALGALGALTSRWATHPC